MKCLVTGGAGFIGSNLVEALLKRGDSVVVLDDMSAGNPKHVEEFKDNPNYKFIKGDIRNDHSELFKEEEFEVIFHPAARPRVSYSIKHPMETNDINVNGTLNMLNLARKHGVKRFIFSSSGSVYGEQEPPFKETMQPKPMSPYALHKHIGEEYCRMFHFLYGMETISLRYFNVYGERMDPNGTYALLHGRAAYKILHGEQPIIYGDGSYTRDYTYVGDVVRANIIAATTNNEKCFGEAFNTGAGKDKSTLFVVETLLKLLGSDLKPKFEPPRIEPAHASADPTKAKELLGYQAEMQYEEGVKKMVEWCKANY